MQDKEVVEDAEEALTSKSEGKAASPDARRDSLEKKDSYEGRRESTKDGKFAFRRMKQPRKEKPGKNSPSRFEGDGIAFKAKLIGLEAVSDARGDKMCQEAMQRLKINVRNTGPHKRKINICISLQGIKIKDEKFGSVIYHHPVSLISFISQDITDARAFGYIFGSIDEPHQFIAIKTEKPAFHVVLALRDLFQTVLDFKQEEIEIVKENKSDEQKMEETLATNDSKKENLENKTFNQNVEATKPKEENIYFEVLLAEPLTLKEEPGTANEIQEPAKSVDDLLGLQNELNKLQQGIAQMDTSIATLAAFNNASDLPENDPFDTSFVLGPKRDSFPLPMPTPVPLVTCISPSENQQVGDPSAQQSNGDKYAVFNALNAGPSIFETPQPEDPAWIDTALTIPDMKDLEEEIMRKTPAPPKPPRHSKTESPDQSVFADLDPLGKDRPYKDKAEFFQDVKNPPKKVLNDLVDRNHEDSGKLFEANLMSSPVTFPVDFEPASSVSHNNLSSSLPNSFCNAKLSLAYSHAKPHNPFEHTDKPPLRTRGSEPVFPIASSPQSKFIAQNNYVNNSYLGKSPPSGTILASNQQQLSVNCTMANLNGSQSSSPIPIPPRQSAFAKERSFSNGSIGSPYSKSPVSYGSESPNQADYFNHNNYSEGYSPVGITMKNGLGHNHHSNFSENSSSGSASPIPNGSSNKHSVTDGANYPKTNTNGNSQNGLSRPRPRPSISKGAPLPSKAQKVLSQSMLNNGSTDNEAINRENMQSITKVLLTNGHRIRAQSLTIESRNDFKLNGENIFTEKNDPFADDFFYSLPKKAHSHIAKKEIPEYV